MIKVLKKGSDRTFVATCKTCVSVLTYKSEDAFPDIGSLFIRCPVCAYKVRVDFTEYDPNSAEKTMSDT